MHGDPVRGRRRRRRGHPRIGHRHRGNARARSRPRRPRTRTASCSPAAAPSAWKPHPACAATSKAAARATTPARPKCRSSRRPSCTTSASARRTCVPLWRWAKPPPPPPPMAAVAEGCVGAGTGATVGKLFGMSQAMKSGIGSFTVALPGGVHGVEPGRRQRLRRRARPGHRQDRRRRAQIARQPRVRRHRAAGDARAAAPAGLVLVNTTLAVVATNARLTKVQATKLAQFASLGMARTIYPVNTMFDGDIAFALSLGDPRRRHQRARRRRRRSRRASHPPRREAREDPGRHPRFGLITDTSESVRETAYKSTKLPPESLPAR